MPAQLTPLACCEVTKEPGEDNEGTNCFFAEGKAQRSRGVPWSGALLCSGWSNGTKPFFLGGLVPFNQL